MFLPLLFSIGFAATKPIQCPAVPPSKELCTNESADPVKTVNASAAPHLLFNFEKKFDCSKLDVDRGDKKTRAFCNEEKPKDWSKDDRELIEKALEGATKHPKLRKAFFDLAKSGPIHLYRVESSISVGPNQTKVVSKESSAFYDSQKGGIGFQDHLFNDLRAKMAACPAVPREVFATQLEHIIIHELAHYYAEYKDLIDLDCRFLNAAGWTRKGLKDLSESSRETLMEKAHVIQIKESESAANELMESAAKKIGYPSYYGVSDPREAFAEFFAHLGRESDESKVIKPSIARWFDANVFEKQTRGAGRPCNK